MGSDFPGLHKDVTLLKWYAGISTLVLFIVITILFFKINDASFKVVSAERINIVEKSGQLRMIMSNKERSPEVLAYGKSYTPPITGGNRPGLIFYNDEGTENGGLVFSGGKDTSGKYEATGHLSFDQYNQNQVLYLTYSDDNGAQNTGLHIDDWQSSPEFWKWRASYKNAEKLPAGPEKDKLLKNLMYPSDSERAFAKRVFVGKDENKTALIILADRMGRPRMQMQVDSNGEAKINFLNERGKITYSLHGN